MKKFINDPFDVVDEMLEGFLDVHKHHVRKLGAARAVVRADAPVKGKVGASPEAVPDTNPPSLGLLGKECLTQ